LSVRGFVCHDAATFPLGVQGLGNLLSMFDVAGYNQARGIRLELAKLTQLATAQIEQLSDHLVMPKQFFVSDR